MALFLSSHMRKSKEENMSRNEPNTQDNPATNMLSKEDEVRTNQEGAPPMPPPPYYQGQPGGFAQPQGGMAPPPYQGQPPAVVYPPGQYPATQYQYVTQAPVYGQPNLVQFPAGQSNVLISGQPGPPDHFLMALMVTLFCFCPTGFIAVMRASEARSAVARGDIELATRYSREAKKFINISIGLGIICFILCVVAMVLYAMRIVQAVNAMDSD